MEKINLNKISEFINQKAVDIFTDYYGNEQVQETQKNIMELFVEDDKKCSYTAGEMNAYMG